jgi:hypothetical protein
MSCDKESNTDALRRKYPIPTELPEATCEGKNTIGCYVDSILFVANYFPNTSSWGSQTYEGGVRAFIENPDDDYIQIIAEHPIRPHEIDNRWMRLSIWYWPEVDSIGHISFQYIGNGEDFDAKHNRLVPTSHPQYNLSYDSALPRLCGAISYAEIAEYNPQDIGDPLVRDTLILRDLRLDLPVYTGRY